MPFKCLLKEIPLEFCYYRDWLLTTCKTFYKDIIRIKFNYRLYAVFAKFSRESTVFLEIKLNKFYYHSTHEGYFCFYLKK